MISVQDVRSFSRPPGRFRALVIKHQSWLLYESTIGLLCNLLSDQHEGRKRRETWIFSVIFVLLPLLQLFWRPFIADIGSCCICVSWLGDKIFWCKVLRTQFCTIWWCLVGGVSWNCNHPLFIKFRSFFFERKWVHLHSWTATLEKKITSIHDHL